MINRDSIVGRIVIVTTVWLVTILNPYKGIRYGEITTYEIKKEKQRVGIRVVEAEKNKSEEYRQRQRPVVSDRVFCYLCDPPQWIEL